MLTVIRRFGGSVNLNLHFHTLALDGSSSNARRAGARSTRRCRLAMRPNPGARRDPAPCAVAAGAPEAGARCRPVEPAGRARRALAHPGPDHEPLGADTVASPATPAPIVTAGTSRVCWRTTVSVQQTGGSMPATIIAAVPTTGSAPSGVKGRRGRAAGMTRADVRVGRRHRDCPSTGIVLPRGIPYGFPS